MVWAAIWWINLHVIVVVAGALPCFRQGTRGLYFTIVLEEKMASLNGIRLVYCSKSKNGVQFLKCILKSFLGVDGWWDEHRTGLGVGLTLLCFHWQHWSCKAVQLDRHTPKQLVIQRLVVAIWLELRASRARPNPSPASEWLRLCPGPKVISTTWVLKENIYKNADSVSQNCAWSFLIPFCIHLCLIVLIKLFEDIWTDVAICKTFCTCFGMSLRAVGKGSNSIPTRKLVYEISLPSDWGERCTEGGNGLYKDR